MFLLRTCDLFSTSLKVCQFPYYQQLYKYSHKA